MMCTRVSMYDRGGRKGEGGGSNVIPLHMKNQALFSSKDKSKKLKCRLLQFLFGALQVKRGFTQ